LIGFNVSDGGTIEVFERENQSEARLDYITALGEGSPLFAECLYLEGTVLLRLTNRLTPDQAAEYEEALREIIGSTVGG